jgi:ribosomal protein L11 methyltransferase
VAAAQANAAVNDVEVSVARVDLRTDSLPAAPTVLANLLRPLLLTYAERMADVPERLVAGGLLATEADEVVAAFARRGLVERERRERDGWASSVLVSAR